MNKNNLTFTVITQKNKIREEIKIYFNNNSNDQNHINGGDFFYTSNVLEYDNAINVFDFLENISKDINILKDVSYNFFKNMLMPEDFNTYEEFKVALDNEKSRLKNINLFQEEKHEKASTLINLYFKFYDTDKFEKVKWEDFVMYFGLNVKPSKIENVIKEDGNFILHDGHKNYLDLIVENDIDKEIDGFRKLLKHSGLTSQNYYECNSTKEILSILITSLFEAKPNIVIKKCKNCKKLFIPDRSDKDCCKRIVEDSNNKTCVTFYKEEDKKRRRTDDPRNKLYKDIYDGLLRKKNNSKSFKKDKEIDGKINHLKKANRDFKKKIRNGKKTIDDRFEWLEKIKRTGVITDD